MASPQRSVLSALALAATSLYVSPSMLVADAAPFSTCATVTTCFVSGGSQTCDVTLGKCPPCVYPNADKFNCWEYDTEVRTAVQCPFVSQKSNYVDCSTAENWTKWGTPTSAASTTATSTVVSTTSNTSSAASATPNSTVASNNSTSSAPGTPATSSSTSSSGGVSSNVIMFGGIGVGALVLLIVLIAICKRRKRKKVMRNTMPRHMVNGSGAGPSKRDRAKSKQQEAFGAPYNNVLDTSKGAYGSYQQEALSVDGMLGEAPLTPVVLGGPPHHHNNGNGQYKSGKSVGNQSGFASVNDLVTQDISIRCTTSANVFDEYLRMKQEMNYDHDDDAMSEVMSEMSDLDSDTMSMHKFSLESSQGVGGLGGLARHHDGGLSITDSEYDEHMRNRGASECYSEMSYNDEKYSFSEDDDMSSEFGRSKLGNSGSGTHGGGGHGGVPDREVEI